jgi:asparagine synthase (glutamine-hydrolysing)
MCGIAGWVTNDGSPVDEPALAAMTASLTHRGPDGGGMHVEPGCGLGHRRLALLDVAGGAQPMTNEDGSVWVVANNEIYNYRELRARLHSAGHRFATGSDTEVLVHLYEEAGIECVDPLIGMFAFAIWDRRTRTLLLARDRFGIKPLYYSIDEHGSLRFASELRALPALPGRSRTIDGAAVREYVRHLAIPDPRTIFCGVHKLPAAHCLIWQEGHIRLRRYWRLPDRDPALSISSSDADDMELALTESAKQSLFSDEPLGIFLSGGIDSSVLAWTVRESSALRTFSVSFSEPHFDESNDSRAVAAALGSQHQEIRVSKDDAVDAATDLLSHCDEPFADSSALPTAILSRAARQSVKAVLAGEGADELFGGSAWHTAADECVTNEALLNWPGKVMFSAGELDAVFSADWRARYGGEAHDPGTGLTDDMPAGTDRLHRALYADLMAYLPSDLLAKMDRFAMRHSLEVRVPYLNHPFAELVWRLPSATKLRNGVRKHLLRTIAARRLPPRVAAKAKQGFAIPIDIWTWQPGRFRDLVYDTLRADSFRHRGWFDLAVVDTMLAEHDRLRALHGHRLWSLVVLEHWLRRKW